MPRALQEKSTVEQIRHRFDAEVDRFSNLESGQQAAMDAPLILDLVARAATCHLHPNGSLLDLGCGAGNFTLRVLSQVSPLDCVLVDLSRPMLERAEQRVTAVNTGKVQTVQSDIRALALKGESFDVILAGQVFHHLRGDLEWETMFSRLYQWLRRDGTLFVADFIAYDDPAIQKIMLDRYADYLVSVGGSAYRDKVLDYCDGEDSPRSVRYQFDLLDKAGFDEFDVLHKNALFTAFYARKRRQKQ